MDFSAELPKVAGIDYKQPIPIAQVFLYESLLTVYVN